MSKFNVFSIAGNSPAGAATAVVGKPVTGLDEYDDFVVLARLIGAVGGTLDVYLQRKLATDVWVDWIHFPQLAGGAAAVKYSAAALPPATAAPTVVGVTDDIGTTGAPALAANVIAPGHPGQTVRCIAVAGGGAAAAAVDIKILARRVL